MVQNVIVNIVLPIVGIGLIIFAVRMPQLLSGRQVVDFTAEKLGLVLRVDAFGLVVLLGFVMTGSPIFLWYKGYEDRLSNLQKKVEGVEAFMAELREYDLRLNLTFPAGQPNPNTMTWPPVAYVQRVGERADRSYDLTNFERGPGGIVVNFKKLRLGDRLYVVVEDSGKRWQSLDMITPGAQLEMRQLETPK